MTEDSLKSINLKEMYDLIDLYKYASIEGERVEFIVYPTKDNERIVTIGLQNGYSRDRDTFIFNDGDLFDKEVYPKLLSYYTHDDSMGNWNIITPEYTGSSIKGTNETQFGNLVYLDTYKEDYFGSLSTKLDEVNEKNTYKKDNLNNNDKIWDEIILYAKERRMLLDFYKGTNFSKNEIENIYDFIVNLSLNVKDINYGKARKARLNNEKYIKDLFNNKEEVLKLGLNDEVYNKIVNTSLIKKIAHLVGIEKRINKRLDLNNEEIKNKIKFATEELDKVEFFDLKNVKDLDNKEYVDSKPKAINELISIFDNEDLYYEEIREQYKEYCFELLEYLDRKNVQRKKNIEEKEEDKSIEFKEFNDAVVNQYDEFKDTIDLIRLAKLDSERYEIIVDNNGNNSKIRIDLLDGATRSDVYEFEFTNKELFNERLNEILNNIYESDPELKSSLICVKKPEQEETKTELINTQDNNEILIKNKSEEVIKIDDKEHLKTINEKSEELEKKNFTLYDIEKQISDYMLEKEKEEKENIKNEYDIDLATYQILVNKYQGELEDKFYRSELLFDEYQVVQKIYKLKDELLDYYNENYGKIDNMNISQIAEFSKKELYLTTIYNIEARYKNNKQRINELKVQNNLIPAGNLLLKTLEKYESNNNNVFLNEIVDININKYKEISEKYNDKASDLTEREVLSDKTDLEKIILYKMKLIDLYNALLLRKDELTKDELKELAEYETKLYKMNEIDAKYQSDISVVISELKKEKEFLMPSSKIWLAALEQEELNRLNDRIDSKRTELTELRNELFEIVPIQKEEKEEEYISEVKDAYDEALSYTSDKSPAIIKVEFDKNNKKEAELIIFNRINEQNVVIYQRTLDIDKLNAALKELRVMYAKENEINYNIKYDVSGSSDKCLLMIGENRRTFNIINGTEEFVLENKKEIENLVDTNKKNK